MILRSARALAGAGFLGVFAALPAIAQDEENFDPAVGYQEERQKEPKKVSGEQEEQKLPEFQLRARDLRSFDELLELLLQPTEIGATRLGYVRPYAMTFLLG